jgi:hypothetical protein
MNASWATEDPREHHETLRCWCRPVVVYRSQATGCRVVVHRSRDGSYPLPGTLALARWHADSPASDDDELTWYG